VQRHEEIKPPSSGSGQQDSDLDSSWSDANHHSMLPALAGFLRALVLRVLRQWIFGMIVGTCPTGVERPDNR